MFFGLPLSAILPHYNAALSKEVVLLIFFQIQFQEEIATSNNESDSLTTKTKSSNHSWVKFFVLNMSPIWNLAMTGVSSNNRTNKKEVFFSQQQCLFDSRCVKKLVVFKKFLTFQTTSHFKSFCAFCAAPSLFFHCALEANPDWCCVITAEKLNTMTEPPPQMKKWRSEVSTRSKGWKNEWTNKQTICLSDSCPLNVGKQIDTSC